MMNVIKNILALFGFIIMLVLAGAQFLLEQIPPFRKKKEQEKC